MKTITQQEYYHALALYILARTTQAKVEEFESQLNDLLKETWGSHLSDAIYDYNNIGTKEEFDSRLEMMEIEVQ